MGTEALQMKQSGADLPAGAGGQLGQLLAHVMSLSMGTTGCTLLLLVFAAVGASLFFGFSWLHVAERVGLFIEKALRRLIEQKEIGRAHVLTPVPNAHLLCRIMLAKKKQ